MAVIHMVQRQRKDDCTMNAPAIGPMTGPTNPVATKTSREMPRVTGEDQISARAPAVTDMDADAPMPLKKRQMKMVYTFWASADGRQNVAKRTTPLKMGMRRPNRSDNGPNINGPNVKPLKGDLLDSLRPRSKSTYKHVKGPTSMKQVVTKIVTSVPTWYSLPICCAP